MSIWLLMVMFLFFLAACGSSGASLPSAEEPEAAKEENTVQTEDAVSQAYTGQEDKFYIYSWNTELSERLEFVYDVYPEMRDRIVYVNVGDAAIYPEKIDRLLQTPEAQDYPDMIVLETEYLKKYTNSDVTIPVTDCGLTDVDVMEMYPYTITAAIDQRNNTLKGVSWQSCPGAFLYRADLAKRLLDVNSPEEMQAKIGTWEDFLATAEEIKEKSDDITRILSSNDDIRKAFLTNKTQAWVTSDGVFHMDETVIAYMDTAYKLETENLTQKTTQWTREWEAGFADGSVFGYFGCTWFLDKIMKESCGGEAAGQGTYGLWNMCQGPAPYYWGGTWLGATAGCSDKALAGQIMRALCCDTEIMTKIAKETQDYVNNKTAMLALAEAGKGISELFGGQDLIPVFISAAQATDVFWISAYDESINELLDIQIKAYLSGGKEKEQAVADFKAAVAEVYPDVTVE